MVVPSVLGCLALYVCVGYIGFTQASLSVLIRPQELFGNCMLCLGCPPIQSVSVAISLHYPLSSIYWGFIKTNLRADFCSQVRTDLFLEVNESGRGEIYSRGVVGL